MMYLVSFKYRLMFGQTARRGQIFIRSPVGIDKESAKDFILEKYEVAGTSGFKPVYLKILKIKEEILC